VKAAHSLNKAAKSRADTAHRAHRNSRPQWVSRWTLPSSTVSSQVRRRKAVLLVLPVRNLAATRRLHFGESKCYW